MFGYPDRLLWSDDGVCSSPGSKPVYHDCGGILATGPRRSIMRNKEGKAETQIKCKMFGQGPGLSFVFRLYLINIPCDFNPLNPELNPICYLLALLAHHFLHVSKIRVKLLTFRRLMSYIYGAPILDVSISHTTTQHSR